MNSIARHDHYRVICRHCREVESECVHIDPRTPEARDPKHQRLTTCEDCRARFDRVEGVL